MNYSIKKYGAVGDGKIFDTSAIQEAIDVCGSHGGGTVVVDPGIYLIKTIYLKNNVELHVSAGAKLQGSENPDDYDDFMAEGFIKQFSPEGTSKCLICASNADNIAITGTGEINGSGPAFYDTDIENDQRFYGKPDIPRPRMVIFYNCRNVRIQDAAFVDSPLWTMWLIGCKEVNIHRVKVVGDQKMINNDGIDIDSCRNVAISDSFFKTGDDCLIIRAIQSVQEEPAISENVTVTNCILNSACQGIRIGCPNDNIIRNCTFSNLVIAGAGNGIHFDNPLRYFREERRGRLDLYNIIFSNITIESDYFPIRINVENGVKLKRLSGITFSDIRAKGSLPITLTGCEQTVIEDIRFNNVRIKIVEDVPIECSYCRGIMLNNVELI